MSQEFFTVTVFLTVSSLAWGQYLEMNRHCQLRPDRRRCGPTFLPRWYFNPFKGNCYLFQYGGCHGNRNNFFTREECLEKCASPSPPNTAPPQPSPPGAEDDDTQIEAYVERCKAPADTGPCRARMNKWYYDAGKRRCFPFIYGECGGNSNRYKSVNECMRKCAISVGIRFVPPYRTNGPQGENPKFEERPIGGDRSIRNPERRGAFFRTFFPLIWQVSIPKKGEAEPKQLPGSPRPDELEVTKTTGAAMTEEVTTPIKAEITTETTTQPPKKMMEVTGMQVSTTPPVKLEEEQELGNENNEAIVVEDDDVDDEEEANDEQPNDAEELEMEDMNEQENEANIENENNIDEKSLVGESEEQGWKSSRESIESSPEEENENVENDYSSTEEKYLKNEDEESEEEPLEINEGTNADIQEEEHKSEDTEDQSEVKNLDSRDSERSTEDEKEKIREDKTQEQNMKRFRGPILRFLFRTPSRYNRRMYSPSRSGQVRRLDYRSYDGPRGMSSEDKFDKFRRPTFRRPSPFEIDHQRRIRFWRERNRTPKNGISLTQVFVNKPPHPPVIPRHPLLPVPLHPYPISPYHGPAVFRYPGTGYSRTFSVQGRQQSGGPPQFSGYYQATRWPANGPKTQVQINFTPRVGEPNLACVQPPAIYRCFFGIPSTTPFWYYDAQIAKCAVSYFAGCGATLNRFNSRLECETTCMVTSPRPEMTPTSKESTEQSTEKSTESAEEIDEKSIEEQTTKPVSTTTPNIELLYVKEAEVSRDRNEELENKVEGTIELSKTHKIHILHELSDNDRLMAADKSSDLEYIMVVGIVCLSGIALLIIVSLGLMYMFKKFRGASPTKTFPNPKKETVIEAILKTHMQANPLPKIVCPVPLGPPQNTSV